MLIQSSAAEKLGFIFLYSLVVITFSRIIALCFFHIMSDSVSQKTGPPTIYGHPSSGPRPKV